MRRIVGAKSVIDVRGIGTGVNAQERQEREIGQTKSQAKKEQYHEGEHKQSCHNDARTASNRNAARKKAHLQGLGHGLQGHVLSFLLSLPTW